MSTIIDVHILQTVPPSNINRDDTGSPKSAVYGGVRRARVSSQAWKRATRLAFESSVDKAELGVRTKRVVELVAEAVTASDASLAEKSHELAAAVLKAAGLKLTANQAREGVEESGYLLFLSRAQVLGLAELALSLGRDGVAPAKKAVQEVLGTKNSVDLALFGRMVADVSDLNVDAAAQVAHAISVHAVDNEYDYFTAVDDHKDAGADEDAGAGMIGTVEFNSSTLYRYATVHADLLGANLTGPETAAAATAAFVRAFATSMPTGKQNTFANRTLPDAVVVTLREDQPVSWVGAFEEPITAKDGRVAAAAQALARHAKELDAAYGHPAVRTWVLAVGTRGDALRGLGEDTSLDTLVTSVRAAVQERLERAK